MGTFYQSNDYTQSQKGSVNEGRFISFGQDPSLEIIAASDPRDDKFGLASDSISIVEGQKTRIGA
jgi:hypothetical protein